MARSGHVAAIRALVGNHRLLLPSVGVAVFDDDRLLLVHHADGDHHWGLPGGAVEPDETPADAAVREVAEETGLAVDLVALAGVLGGPEHEIRYDNGDVTGYVTTVFTARPVDPTALLLDRSELRDAAWVPVTQLGGLALPPIARAAVDAALSVHLHDAPAVFQSPRRGS